MSAETAVELTRGDSRLAEELTSHEVLSGGFGFWTQAFGAISGDNPTTIWRDMVADRAIQHYTDQEEKDGHYSSQLETRKEAVLSKPRRVVAASDSAADQRVASFIEDVLEGLKDFENVLYETLDALGKGVSIAELMYEPDGRQIRVSELRFRQQNAFTFNGLGEPPCGPLRIAGLGGGASDAEPLPENKFLVYSFRPLHGNRWGRPLGRRCFWMVWFKRQDIRAWLKFVEKGSGTVLTKYPRGAGTEMVTKALKAAEAINDETAVAIPEDFIVDMLTQARGVGSGSHFKDLAEILANAEISKVILGQTLTSAGSDKGSGSLALGKVHDDVRNEKKEVDAKGLMGAINQQLIRPLVTLNYGPQVAAPRWVIDYEDGEDLGAVAERDERLVGMGVPMPVSYFVKRYQLPEFEQDDEVVRPLTRGPAGAAVAGESPDEFTDPPHREPEVVAAAAVGQASPVYAAMVERVMERAAAGLPEEDEDLDL